MCVTQPRGYKQPLTTLVEPAFFDDRHLVHGGSVTRCHLAWDSSGQQGMQEAQLTENNLQDKRGAHQSWRGIGPQSLLSGPAGSEAPVAALFAMYTVEPVRVESPAPGAQGGGRCGYVPRDPNLGRKDTTLTSEPYSAGIRALWPMCRLDLVLDTHDPR